jgi:hypothetical protein
MKKTKDNLREKINFLFTELKHYTKDQTKLTALFLEKFEELRKKEFAIIEKMQKTSTLNENFNIFHNIVSDQEDLVLSFFYEYERIKDNQNKTIQLIKQERTKLFFINEKEEKYFFIGNQNKKNELLKEYQKISIHFRINARSNLYQVTDQKVLYFWEYFKNFKAFEYDFDFWNCGKKPYFAKRKEQADKQKYKKYKRN